MFIAIILIFLGLALIFTLGYAVWGTGQELADTPWYIPVMHAFTGLAALSVAYLALGRYRVQHDPASYWIGIGFAAFSGLSLLFILTWPGLLPGGRGILARLPSTSAWVAWLELIDLSLALPAAVLAAWPGKPNRVLRYGFAAASGWIGGVLLLAVLAIAFESKLPLLVGKNGAFSPLLLGSDWVFLLLFAFGALLSTYRYRQTGDSPLGYVAIAQVAVFFVVLTALIGAKRYDIWYYLSRIILAGGFLTVFYGQLAGYVALLLRERKLRTDNQLQKALLDSIFEADPGGLAVITGPELRFAFVNPAYRYLIPQLEKDPVGQPYQAVWADDTGHADPEQIVEVLTTGKPFQHNHVVRTYPDGAQRSFTLQARRIDWEEAPAVLLILWDVTELKQTERALRLSEEKYRTTLNSIGDAVITTDTQERVTFLNPVAERLIGRTGKEAIGQPLERVFPILDEQTGRSALNPVKEGLQLGSSRALSNHTVLKTPDGRTIPIEDSAAPIRDDTEQVLGAVMVFHDVTLKRETEQKQAYLASFPEKNPNPICEVDEAGILRYANPAMQALLPDPSGQELPGDWLDGWEQVARSFLKGGATSLIREITYQERIYQQVLHYLPEEQLIRIYSMDISDRRRAEAELLRDQRVLAQAGHMAHLGAWEIPILHPDDFNANPLYWSDETYRIFGYEPGEVAVSNPLFFEHVPPEDQVRISETVSRAVQEHQPYHLEHRILRKGGEERIVVEHGDMVYDEEGHLTRVIGSVQDITERKRAENRLLQSEAVLEAFFANSPGLLNIEDEEFRYLKTDPLTPTYFGLDRQSIVGKAVGDLSPEFIEQFGPMMRRVIETGQPALNQEVSAPVPGRPGEVTSWQASYFPVPLPGGKTGIGIMGVDITERKQAEQAMALSEARLQALVAASAQVIYWMSPDWKEMIQLQGGGFLADTTHPNRSWLNEYIHPDDQQWVQGVIANAIQEGTIFELEHRVLRVDGTLGWTFSRAVPVRNAAGEIVEWFGAASDITERKQAEQELKASHARLANMALVLEEDPNPVARVIYNGKVIFRNPAAKKLPGWNVDINKSLPDPMWQLLEQAIQSGRLVRQEVRLGSSQYSIMVVPFPWNRYANVYGQDITDLKQAEQAARSKSVQIELQQRLLEQREQERLQIARDLHDGPVQELTRAALDVQTMIWDEQNSEKIQKLEALRAGLQSQIGDLRAYAGELRPPSLDKFGLGKAIRSHLDEFQEKHPDLQVQFEEHQTGELVPEGMRLALFRIYQEGMTNIVKHAHATQVKVRLVKTEEQVILDVEDNGVGFQMPGDWLDLARHGHLGLVGIRERAEAIGGSAEIHSTQGGGTHLVISVPLGLPPSQ